MCEIFAQSIRCYSTVLIQQLLKAFCDIWDCSNS